MRGRSGRYRSGGSSERGGIRDHEEIVEKVAASGVGNIDNERMFRGVGKWW